MHKKKGFLNCSTDIQGLLGPRACGCSPQGGQLCQVCLQLGDTIDVSKQIYYHVSKNDQVVYSFRNFLARLVDLIRNFFLLLWSSLLFNFSRAPSPFIWVGLLFGTLQDNTLTPVQGQMSQNCSFYIKFAVRLSVFLFNP